MGRSLSITLQQFSAVRYNRVPLMPDNQGGSSNDDLQQQQQAQHQVAIPSSQIVPARSDPAAADSFDELEDDETAVLIKHSTSSRSQKKAERTPLLDHHPSADRKTERRENMLSPDEGAAGTRGERVNTFDSQQSDEEIARNCLEEYGSTSGADFAACLVEAIRAINHGIYPERIPQGSSGSYFVKNLQGEKIGVFKPKNEEPYGSLNPKWIKWLHKIFFPCCFGRSCLVPNQGYLSEAGASLIDQRLGLNVVPKTAVVSLAAPTFNYNRMDRAMARTKERIQERYPDIGRHFRRIGLPPKRGSFQLFVHGYRDATYWLRQWDLYPDMAPPAPTMQEFQLEFERMVILDYIIRNTDRGNDNWLIRYEQADVEAEEEEARKTKKIGSATAAEGKLIDIPPEDPQPQQQTLTQQGGSLTSERTLTEETLMRKQQLGNPATAQSSSATDLCQTETDSTTTLKAEGNGDGGKEDIDIINNKKSSEEAWESVGMPRVSIAAIDNGLAFPFKHPDQWRAYPYRWANLSFAQKPFSEATVHQVLPLIDNTDFVRSIGNDLRKIFESDPGFDKKTFAKQLSVIRGQMFNLREALRTRRSPAQLVQMTPQYMIEIKKKKRRRFQRMIKHFAATNPGAVVTDSLAHQPPPASVVTTTTITEQPTNNIPSATAATVPVPTIVDVVVEDVPGQSGSMPLAPDTHALVAGTSSSATTTSITIIRPGREVAETTVAVPALTDDETDDPKSWHNTFQQKMQTRSPFFAMW